MHIVLFMQTMQETSTATLMTAEDVQDLLGVDRSTVYRMAQDGRLSAIKVGRQWRFPTSPIRELLGNAIPSRPPDTKNNATGTLEPSDGPGLQPTLDLVAELLGVMMVVTDMEGNPVTDVANPCAWFAERRDDPAVLEECVADWRAFASEQAFAPRFRLGPHDFECARSLVRHGNHLVGMVLAGGVAPGDWPAGRERDATDGLYHLTSDDRATLLAALPRVAAAVARIARPSESIARSE